MKIHLQLLSILALVSFLTTSAYSQALAVDLCANTTADNNGLVHVDITVDNFTEISAYQFGLAWNSLKYQFVSVEPKADLPGYSAASFGPATDNVPDGITVMATLWFHPAGLASSLPGGTVLCTFTFDAENTTDLSDIGIAPDSDFMLEFADYDVNELPVNIGGSSCSVFAFLSTDVDDTFNVTNDWTISPNPSADFIHIDSDQNQNVSINIYNSIGKRVHAADLINTQKYPLDIQSFVAGYYTAEIINYEQKTIQKQSFIKL